MWNFGSSTIKTKSLWIAGVTILIISIIIVLRKWIIHLRAGESRFSEKAEADQLEAGKCKEIITPKGTPPKSPNSYCFSGAIIRTYALEELKVATRDFKIRIGVGATSYVYLAEIGDGRFGAVKRVMVERGGSRKIFLDEVSVLLRISHPNLVGLFGFCLEKGEQLLLLEYVPNKSLFDRLHTRHGESMGVLQWSSRIRIAHDIAKALDYLHSLADPPVIHRDVKSSNILLVDDDHAKLADFGLCKLGHDVQAAQTPTIIKGSLGYIDMNYLNTGRVSPKSNVYSFGVLLLELITGLKSLQGSVTLPEWTEECRKSEDLEVLVGMLDPNFDGDVNIEQFRVLVDVANLALLENCEERPDMSQISYRISSCMEAQKQTELPV